MRLCVQERVIWKWETEMTDAPANVLISSWLPQLALLAHPNVKVLKYSTLGEVDFWIFWFFNFLQFAIDGKNNSKTKVEKVFFFIFMST
jgi:hypothetical protein